MNDRSSISEQRTPIVQPRTAVGVDAVPPPVPLVADLPAPVADTGGVVRLEKATPSVRYEDLPEAVRNEFEKLITTRNWLVNFFGRRVNDPGIAEDLTGDVFEVLVRKLMRGEHICITSQRAYATGIARNVLLTHWRKVKIQLKGTEPESSPQWIDAELLTSDHLELDGKAVADEFSAFNEMEGIKGLIQHCAQTLTEYQITVFYLRTVCEFSYEDISLILEREPGVLRVCHNEALSKIRADVVGLADLRLEARHLAYSAEETKKVPYAKRRAAARKRFGSRK